MSVNGRREALSLCLNPTIVVIVQIVDQFLFEVFHELELLQIEQLTFEKTKDILRNCIVQRICLTPHTLADSLFLSMRRSNLSHFSLVRFIFLNSDTAGQPQLLHQALHSHVVEKKSSATQYHSNAPVSVPAFVLVVNIRDFCFCRRVFVGLLHLL